MILCKSILHRLYGGNRSNKHPLHHAVLHQLLATAEIADVDAGAPQELILIQRLQAEAAALVPVVDAEPS